MWAEAYLEQARSDWEVWELIRQQELPSCHALHYLQMTCEKLGKAFLITGGTLAVEQARNSHVAFKRFLQVASRNPALQRLLKMNTLQFRAHIKKCCLSLRPSKGSLRRWRKMDPMSNIHGKVRIKKFIYLYIMIFQYTTNYGSQRV